MTREEWIKVRDEPHIPLGVWFSYYKENGGEIEDPIEFEKEFKRKMEMYPIYLMGGRLMQLNMQSARHRLTGYYDSIFSL